MKACPTLGIELVGGWGGEEDPAYFSESLGIHAREIKQILC